MSDSAIVDGTNGASGDDTLAATDEGSKLVGGSGDDTLESGSGNDVLNGGSGVDSAYYDADVQAFLNDEGVLSLYDEKGNMVTFDAGDFGTDILKSIEVIQFNNYTYYMDGRNNTVLAVNDVATTDEDSEITNVDVLTNDIDLDGDTLVVTALNTSGATGTFTLNINGTISYDPAGGFEHLARGQDATDSVEYTVTDGNGSTVTGTFTVTVTGVNDAPIAQDEADFSATEDTPIINDQVLATDIDHGSVVTYHLAGDTPAGLIFNNDGSYSFDPSHQAYQEKESGETTQVSFTWYATDQHGTASASDTVTITISHTDDGAVAVDVNGVVTDGYIVGATVYSEEDGIDGLTAGDISATTNGMGQFTLEGTTGELFMLGGTDVATGLAFEGTLKAPAGSSSLTSLSTLVSELIELGLSQADAETAVKATFAIDASINILTIDPIQATLSADTVESDAGRSVMATAAQVLNSAIQIASLIVGASAGSISQADAMNMTFTEMANGIHSEAAYNLLDPAHVMTLIQTVAEAADARTEVNLNDISSIQFNAAELIASVNHETQDVLDSATTSFEFLTDLTQVSIVAQAESSAALSDSASTGDAVAIMTVDNNLTALVAAAESSVGEVDGIQNTVYTPTSNQITVNTFASNNGFVIQGDGANKWFDNVEQLTVDNSATVLADSYVTLNTSYGVGASLFNTGVIYEGSSGDDTFQVNSNSWADTKTSLVLHLGDGDDHGQGGSFNDILEGGNGNDTLAGFGGDDIIIGGSGMADQLYGDDLFASGLYGSGADRFVFQAGDTDGVWDLNNDGQLIVGYVDLDLIHDFDVTEGDVLDLAGLLSDVTDGLTEDGTSLQHLLDFTFNGHSTVIGIDVNGDGVDIATAGTGYYNVATTDISADQKIILTGQDITAGGTLSDAQIIDSLLATGSIDLMS